MMVCSAVLMRQDYSPAMARHLLHCGQKYGEMVGNKR